MYAYIHNKESGARTRIYVGPFYNYKGVREWGQFQQDLARSNNRISQEELLNQLGEERFNKRARPYLHIGQAKADYQYALTQVLSKSIAEDVMNNFYYGNGRKLSYGPDSKMAKDLKKHKGFQTYFSNYLTFLQDLISRRQLSNTDNQTFERQFRTINFSNISEILPYNFYGLMGGTQKTIVEFEVKQITINQYEIKTTMYIQDWYGADRDDINSDRGIKSIRDSGLWAFFMLQHFHGCTPFQTELIYESTDIIIADIVNREENTTE